MDCQGKVSVLTENTVLSLSCWAPDPRAAG